MTLTIRRKGYYVRPHRAKVGGKTVNRRGHYVHPSMFTITDRGAQGRGPQVIPPLRRGGLGGPGFFEKSDGEQRRILAHVAATEGEAVAVGRLRALEVYFKRTDPQKSLKAQALAEEISCGFIGKRRVPQPTGCRRRGGTQ